MKWAYTDELYEKRGKRRSKFRCKQGKILLYNVCFGEIQRKETSGGRMIREPQNTVANLQGQ